MYTRLNALGGIKQSDMKEQDSLKVILGIYILAKHRRCQGLTGVGRILRKLTLFLVYHMLDQAENKGAPQGMLKKLENMPGL